MEGGQAMYFRLTLLALSALLLLGHTALADVTPDSCNIEVEGATALMSADEAAAEWSGQGYVVVPDPYAGRGRRRGTGHAELLHFKASGPQPNSHLAKYLVRKSFNTGDMTFNPKSVSLSGTYAIPEDPSQLAAFNQFVDDTFAAWCNWAEPRFATQPGFSGRPGRTTIWSMKTCKAFRAMQAGHGDVWDHGTRKQGTLIQNWDGCNWKVGVTNSALIITVIGPRTPK